MARMHPDGRHVIVCCWRDFYVFEIVEKSVQLIKTNATPFIQVGFDISPNGDRLIATALSHDYTEETDDENIDVQIYLFSVDHDRIEFLHQITIGLGGNGDRYIFAGCLGKAGKMPLRCHVAVT
jgi:hypothetical protein